MLSIGEFSNICKVSTKTLRYYAQIGLILPIEINPENGYRYYSIDQLETMLLINRLKSYHFSLDEIKQILELGESQNTVLFMKLNQKKEDIKKQLQVYEENLKQIKEDMNNIKDGKTIMSYLDKIDVQFIDVSPINILSIRKMILEDGFPQEYQKCFGALLERINKGNLKVSSPPMVLFHSDEFTPQGLDTEFAIPVKEKTMGTRLFDPGPCLKTVLYGSYSGLPSVYMKQREWAEQYGYECSDAVFEVYVNDPSCIINENELITEVYYPVKKGEDNESR